MARVTVEDCLKKINNRFILVLLAVMRTRQLMKGSNPFIDRHNDNEQVIALREIASKNVCIDDTKLKEDSFHKYY